MTAYLDIAGALQVVDRYGFHSRDVGLLASALARPETTDMGSEAYPELAVKAVVLWIRSPRFHLLIDGNKRTCPGASGPASAWGKTPCWSSPRRTLLPRERASMWRNLLVDLSWRYPRTKTQS
ncbi:Fic family protein [Arthrobacter sp. SAFR-179]|uniref:Fic family protein n=1 Tax=Arthrobacter sp. SAFR-179 TaxID=3387279 RepID=UPI003F7CC064